MDIIFPYQESKLKPYLKMAVQRLQIAKNKKSTMSKHEKRDIAQLLANGKDELARIKTEHVSFQNYSLLPFNFHRLSERTSQ